MEDDELTRARRALRGVDPELDLSRAYAESWARAHGTEAHDDWVPDERVEIVLNGAGPDGAGPGRRRPRHVVRRWPVLAWSAATAAAVALVVTVAGLPAQRTVPPGSAPGVSAPGVSAPNPSVSPTMGRGPTPVPKPTAGLTPPLVVGNAAEAVAAASCGVKTESTLGDESMLRFDDAGAADTDAPASEATDGEATDGKTPLPAPLGEQPLEVLQREAVGAALDLSGLAGTDYRLHKDLTLEEEDGTFLARIRFTPPAGLVPGGEVTRMDLLVDTTTWLPHTEQTWAQSDDGRKYLVLSEFSWTTCGEPRPSLFPSPTPSP